MIKKSKIFIFCISFLCFYNGYTIKISNLDSLIHSLKKEFNSKINDNNYDYVLKTIKLSGLYNRINQYDSAFHLIQQTLNSNSKFSSNEKLLLWSEAANYYKNIGKDDKALECFHLADAYASRVTEPCAKVYHSLNKAEFYRKIANHKQAEVELKAAKKLIDRYNTCDSVLLIRYYHRLAAVMNETSVDSVVHYSLKSIQLSRSLGDLYSEAISLNELGFYYKNRKMLDTSAKCYLQAELNWKKYGSYANAIHAMYNRALLIAHNNMPRKESTAILKDIVKTLKENKIVYPLENVYDAIRDNYYFLGDSTNFYRYKIFALQERMYANVNRHEADIRKVLEKYKNDSIKAEVKAVSGKLIATKEVLNEKDTENKRVYVFLVILILLLVLIAYLFYRIYIANNILKEKFKEKEALVQEIHHRVKNNLQFVNSIINMQTNVLQNQQETTILIDTSRRIRSMALVHEMLYNKNNESGINMSQYLNELINNINDLTNHSEKKIDFKLNVQELFFDVTKATAIGMIVSELVSNSIKHAFNKTINPQIKVELTQIKQSHYQLLYTDSGPGMPKEYNKTNKLGMRLIDIFSRQIKGSYDFENKNGLEYKLSFG